MDFDEDDYACPLSGNTLSNLFGGEAYIMNARKIAKAKRIVV